MRPYEAELRRMALAARMRPRDSSPERAEMVRKQEAARRERERERAAERCKPAPLVAGSIYGVRAFRTTPADLLSAGPGRPNRLWPLSTVGAAPWVPGWNDATCPHRCAEPANSRDEDLQRQLQHLHMVFRIGAGARFAVASRPPLPATVAMDCSCGFHAFTNLDEMRDQVPSSDPDLVAGIVEGAGTTVEAEHGFRSRRARLVALVAPRPSIRLAPTLTAFLLCLFVVVMGAQSALDGWTGWEWVNAVLLPLNAFCVVVNGRWLWKWWRAHRSMRARAAAFGVPLFRSQAEAVARFPLGLAGPDRTTS